MARLAPLLPLALGALAACGFAPLEWWPVTIACVAGWLGWAHRAATLRQALWRGWLFGVGHFTIGNNWIAHAFTYQDAMPAWLGYVAVVALALYLAVYPMLAAGLAWTYGRGRSGPDLAYALVAGAAWIVTEWLRARMFTGYAWNPLSVMWMPVPGVSRSAAWIGTYALSGLTVAAAGALLPLLERRWQVPLAVAGAIALLALTPRAPAPATRGDRLVRLVQPNISQVERNDPGYAERGIRRLAALSGTPGPVPRLLLWPEGAIDHFVEEGYPRYWYFRGSAARTRARLARLLGPRDLLLTGGTALFFDDQGELSTAGNSVFALDPDARLLGRYDKAHLVPYGEYLPMRPLLERIGLSRLVPGDVDFVQGPGPRGLTMPGFGVIGFQICYEIIFSGEVVDPRHRPAMLFNPSNDAWFGAWGPPQHLAQARLRVIEEGVPMVRATPTGISAVIAADGRLVAAAPQGRAVAIEVAMPGARPPTPFARWGNRLAALAVPLLLGFAVAFRRGRRYRAT